MASRSPISISTAIGCFLLLSILMVDRIWRSNYSPPNEYNNYDNQVITQGSSPNQTINVLENDRPFSDTDIIFLDSSSLNILHNQTASSVIVNNSVGGMQRSTETVRFIPFPYRTLGSGIDMRCEWETRHVSEPSAYDFIQLTAFEEGVCIPTSSNRTIHIFSSSEARQCLNLKRIIISGDSYMKQLFIGLADVLLGKKLRNDKQITDSTMRAQFVQSAKYWLAQRHRKDATFPNVAYLCEIPCYGKVASFSKKCSYCINSYTLEDENTVAVVGAGVHIMARLGKNLNSTAQELGKFLNMVQRTIFTSMPSYEILKVPAPYKEISSQRNNLYSMILPDLAPRNPSHPFLDVYQLTRSCTMNNCSYDGGHRSRYVNRWKAQLLLNTLCEINKE